MHFSPFFCVELRNNPEFLPLMNRDRTNWPRCLLGHGWLPGLTSRSSGSPWAAASSDLASHKLESALGPYPLSTHSTCHPFWDQDDAQDMVDDVPVAPIIWTDGSREPIPHLDVEVAGAGALVPSPAINFGSNHWSYAQGLACHYVHFMLSLRGMDTVKVSKVEGHATQAMVDNGDVRLEDLVGNKGADTAADLGRCRQQDAWSSDGLSWCRLLVESAWSSVLSRFELLTVHWHVWLLWLHGGLTECYSSVSGLGLTVDACSFCCTCRRDGRTQRAASRSCSATQGAEAAFDATARTAVHPHGPGNGDAPLVQGAHRVRRSTEPDHSHQAREGEVREQHHSLLAQERPLPGTRPAPLLEVLPQVGAQRHTVDQIVDAVPVPLMVEQLVDVLQLFDALIPVAEQVIDVPKIFVERIPPRTSVREPQLAEQLVEVPTIVSFSSLQRILEQTVDVPVPRGGVRGRQGFPPRTGFNDVFFLSGTHF